MKQVLIAMGCLALTACSGVEGNGDTATETRYVTDFTEVTNMTLVDVIVTFADEPSATLECDSNLLREFDIEIEGGELKVVRHDVGWVNPHGPCNLYLTTSELYKVKGQGSGDVAVSDIDQSFMQAENVGSGDIFLFGDVDEVELDVHGSGDIHAADLYATDANADVSGSGNIHLYARGSVQARVSGSGNILIYGHPVDLDVATPGSGDVYIY